jgi:hypothetical protein
MSPCCQNRHLRFSRPKMRAVDAGTMAHPRSRHGARKRRRRAFQARAMRSLLIAGRTRVSSRRLWMVPTTTAAAVAIRRGDLRRPSRVGALSYHRKASAAHERLGSLQCPLISAKKVSSALSLSALDRHTTRKAQHAALHLAYRQPRAASWPVTSRLGRSHRSRDPRE